MKQQQKARKAYNEGNAKFKIVPEECALLVIDMQDEFVKPQMTMYPTDCYIN